MSYIYIFTIVFVVEYDNNVYIRKTIQYKALFAGGHKQRVYVVIKVRQTTVQIQRPFSLYGADGLSQRKRILLAVHFFARKQVRL